MRLIRFLATAGLLSTAAFPAAAQMKLDLPKPAETAPAQVPVPAGPAAPFTYQKPVAPAAAPADQAPQAPGIDESALRYWASQEDVARVSAEIRRIKASHPDWEPPVDLFAPSRQYEDEKPLWALYAEGDYAGVRQAIADIKAQRPNWQPSADLAKKIEQAETRQSLVAASESGDVGAVLSIASEHNEMLVCDQIDVLWRVAEALANSGDNDRAMQAYRYILSSCRNPQERLATVQKAGVLLGPEAVTQLTALGQRGSDGRNEFEQVRLDQMRGKIGGAMSDALAEAPSPAEIAGFEKMVKLTKSAGDAQLLGWYAYHLQDYPRAYEWFKTAMSWAREPKSVEGMALSLREMGKIAEAEEVAFQTISDPLVRKIYIELVSGQITGPQAVPLAPDKMTRFASIVDTAQSALGAQSLGWAAYNAANLQLAYDWFQKSVRWGESEEGVIGLLVTSKRLGKEQEYRQLSAAYSGRYAVIAELSGKLNYKVGGGGGKGGDGLSAAARQAIDQYKRKDYNAALATLQSMPSKDRGMRVMEAWAQYNSGDWEGAKKSFAELEQKSPGTDSSHGLRVIQQRQMPPQFRNKR